MKWPEDFINSIITGNHLVVMPDIPDRVIDLTVTSPPYDNLRDYKGYDFKFEPLAKELYRVTKKGGVVVWVVGDATIDGSETGTSFRQALYFKELGFNLHDTMIWFKSSPPLTHNRYEQYFEYMFILSKGSLKVFNPIMENKKWIDNRKFKMMRREKDNSIDIGFISKKRTKIIGNVWKINTGGGHNTKDKIAYKHPAIFPEALARDHILSWSNPGDILLDPMCGSGTTCKMAKQYNRKYIGIDLGYKEIAEERLRQEVLPV